MVRSGGGKCVSVAGCGMSAISPCFLSMETTTMKTMMSTSSTSIMGVTLISGLPGSPPENAICHSSQARACLPHQTPAAEARFPAVRRQAQDRVEEEAEEAVVWEERAVSIGAHSARDTGRQRNRWRMRERTRRAAQR